MTAIDPRHTLADLASTIPGAAQVFYEHGLDFCCRGRRPLAEACAERSLAPEDLAVEIERAGATASTPLVGWEARPLEHLIRHITDGYHARLRRMLPIVAGMAEKFEARHADKPSVPRGLGAHLRALEAAALQHLDKEERLVFPAILGGRAGALGAPVHCLEDEHLDHGAALARTRALTNDLTPPAEACTTWRALYLGLEQLERELMEHIHLENNVLFPRALAAA